MRLGGSGQWRRGRGDTELVLDDADGWKVGRLKMKMEYEDEESPDGVPKTSVLLAYPYDHYESSLIISDKPLIPLGLSSELY